MLQSIRTILEERLDAKIDDLSPVSGGDINQALKASISGGNSYFIKFNTYPHGNRMLEEEAKALRILEQAGTNVPLVIDQFVSEVNQAVLILEWIDLGRHSHDSEVSGGRQLARQHQATSKFYGWDSDNYIATIDQANSKCKSWPEFYIEYRIRPLISKCVEQGTLPSPYLTKPDVLRTYMELHCPIEPPSLIHGDLWAGNSLTSADRQYYFIDPASCYASREMDLAMSQLFGGFSTSFYDAYEEVYPIAPDYTKRRDLYQLYYLLVHLALFGRSYQRSVVNAIGKYCNGVA